MRPDARKITVTERPEAPWLAVMFGFGPMLPLVAGSLFAWWRRDDLGVAVQFLTIHWACAILLFLSGVRRGLSFRTEGGETLAQVATMLGLFGLGFLALLAVALGQTVPALVLLILGFTGIAHLFEHLMFKGSEKYGPRAFFNELEAQGAAVAAAGER